MKKENLGAKEKFTQEEIDNLIKAISPPDKYILAAVSKSSDEKRITREVERISQKINNAEKKELQQENVDFINLEDASVNSRIQDYVSNSIKEVLDDETIGKDGNMSFVIGAPGAGKSSIINMIKNTDGAFHANADKIKEDLSKMFGIPINHPKMHSFSVKLMNQIVGKLKEEKVNFILEKIGDEPNQIYNMSNEIKDQGYNVNMYCVHVDCQECRQRNVSRCESLMAKSKPPRLVDDEFIQKVGNNPLNTYLLLTKQCPEMFKNCKCYSNQVEFGSFPQELPTLSLKNGKKLDNSNYVQNGISTSKLILSQITQSYTNILKQAGHGVVASNIDNFVSRMGKGNESSLSSQEGKIVGLILAEFKDSLQELFHPALISKMSKDERFLISEQIDYNQLIQITSKILKERLDYDVIAEKLNQADNSLNLPVKNSKKTANQEATKKQEEGAEKSSKKDENKDFDSVAEKAV